MSSITYCDVPYYVEGKPGSAIGIIVIQEWWGLNNHIKNMTKRFAEHFNALAITPDLYRGKVADSADEANHLMSNLNWPGAVKDIQNACEYLKSQGCKKIGVVGFCMGGALVIASCVKVDLVDAGCCFYGIPPKALADPKDLNKPIQFHFGDKDNSPGFSDIAAADQLRDTIKSAGHLNVIETRHADVQYSEPTRNGKVAEFHRYVDGDHAFMNEEAPAYPFNAEISNLALQHTKSFFKAYLQ